MQRFGYPVYFTEYERGWGSGDCGVDFYRSKEAAAIAAIEYNAKNNTQQYVPDYYIRADASPHPVELKDGDFYRE